MFRVSSLLMLMVFYSHSQASDREAVELIQNAIDNVRGLTSYSEASMTIHRPDWQRTMSLKAWTEGMKKSLVRITEPTKDRGNGTLLIDKDMWSYSPKINRIIKIPSSMSNQSWMGSDFSNNDIARGDDIIDQYTHTIRSKQTQNNVTTYVIESVPKEEAAVVWGKEVITVNSHNVVLKHEFYDQDNILIKTMSSHDVRQINKRHVPFRQRMQQAARDDEWTEFTTRLVQFDITIPKNMFTLSNLRNPR